MSMDEVRGDWQLVKYHYIDDEIVYESEEENDTKGPEIDAWLFGNSNDLISEALPKSGLTIQIEDDRYTEVVTKFDELMFDTDGVQVNDYVATNGKIVDCQGRICLMPEGIPKWGTSKSAKRRGLRFDDRDTKICDHLGLAKDLLVRNLSVVTDESCLVRILLVYARLK